MSRPRILLLDHASSSVRSLASALEREGYAVAHTAEVASALATIRAAGCELVLGEIGLAAAEVLAEALRSEQAPPVILLDDFEDLTGHLDAIRRGAFDALSRPVSDEQVLLAVRRALESHTLKVENARLREVVDRRFELGSLVSTDPRMERVFATVRAVADSRATLLIQGESGTGKTVLARAMHELSSRKGGPFVAVDCGSLPGSLLETELFGHVKGAFTGALRDRAGKFELADGGTIFLDEIANASSELQQKLLRFLEEGRFERVGDARTRSSDARVIAATHVDLQEAVQDGRFREDLYYRIHVVAIELPPLRERMGDVPLLAERFRRHFAARHARTVEGFTEDAVALLCAHPWPGNVRELENTVERAVLLATGSRLDRADLWPDRPPSGRAGRNQTLASDGELAALENAPPGPLKRALEVPERWLIRRALAANGGNRSLTAQVLGINRTTLFNKMRKYDLLSFPVGKGAAAKEGRASA
jgi:DNA-binding NtrC family response regulator